MLKNFTILVFMFLMMASYGQKSTLLQNINFRAKELKHSLNKDGDSLILESEKTIYSVDIFNQDFEKTVEVDDNEIKIPLNGTPLGRLVVQAKMADKRIIMTLLRHVAIEEKPIIKKHRPRLKTTDLVAFEDINLSLKVNAFGVDTRTVLLIKPIEPIITTTIPQENPIEIATTEKEEPISSQNNVSNRQNNSIANMLNWKPKKDNISDKVFWISYVINNGTNSSKKMKMVTHIEADELITKHKAELKTNQGKLNQLTIWEVYNTAKFMEKQVENPDYINSIVSNLFNVKPYFSSIKKNTQDNITVLAQNKNN